MTDQVKGTVYFAFDLVIDPPPGRHPDVEHLGAAFQIPFGDLIETFNAEHVGGSITSMRYYGATPAVADAVPLSDVPFD